jgi:undecaprenyl-diphosphatase
MSRLPAWQARDSSLHEERGLEKPFTGTFEGLPALGAGSRGGEPEAGARLSTAAAILSLVGLLGLLITLGSALGWLAVGPWRPAVAALDYAVAVRIHALRSPWLDAPMWSLSWIGEMVPMAAVTGSLFFYVLRRRRRFSALCVALSMPGTAIMWKVTSLLVERGRPDFWVHHRPGDLGYPGGHVMNAVVIAGVCLSMLWPRAERPWQKAAAVLFWLLFVTGTAMSRIYVNAHFFTDNVAGLLMGLLWVILALQVCRRAFPDVRDAEG